MSKELSKFKNSLDKLSPKLKETFIDLLYNFRFNEKELIKKSEVVKCSFILDEKTLEKFKQYIDERFDNLSGRTNTPISFVAEVGYTDSMVEKFPSYEQLLKYAGDQKSPRTLLMKWEVLLENPINSVGSIEIIFNTRTKKADEMSIYYIPISFVQLSISGVQKDWVEESFNTVKSIIEAIKLSGIYRPLLIFKNFGFVDLASWVISFGLMYPAQLYFMRSFDRNRELEVENIKLEALEEIKNNDNLNEKINLIAEQLLSPEDKSPILTMALALLLGFGLLYFLRLIMLRVLPLLVPRSGILIGLERNRFENYQNVFKLIVVSIVIVGLGSKVIYEIIKGFFF